MDAYAGADLEKGDGRNRTSLFHAVTYNRQEYVKFMMSQGANVNAVDTHGWSPLDFAQGSQYMEMASLLIGFGGISCKNG
jgi:ankyrin repeat protein